MSEPVADEERVREAEKAALARVRAEQDGDVVLIDDSLEDEEEVETFAEDRTLSEDFVDAVAEAVEAGDAAEARALCEDLHPADLADLLGFLSEEERTALIHLFGGELDPEVLAELDSDIRESVVMALRPEKVAEAVADLDTDDAAFLLEDLDDDVRAGILAEMPAADRIALSAALDYEEDSAGRLMQREVFAAPGYWTVGQIIDRLRGSDDLPDRFYEVFVVNPTNKPIGSVPLSTLLKTRR
ncbi:MAG: hypothetical protein RIE56_09225, partial [Amphiplicatus sp.]